jgi:hypothetical protein
MITNLIGKKFGKLCVIKKVKKPGHLKKADRSFFWLCRCFCGKRVVVPTNRLRWGTRSCGCLTLANIKGMRFGHLVAIKRLKKKVGGRYIWRCVCDCGKKKEAHATRLLQGGVKSCGCVGNSKDLSDKRFGKLRALEKTQKRQNRNVFWQCLCDCGKRVNVQATSLISGHTQSCGCLVNRTGEQNPRWIGYGGISGRFWWTVKECAEIRNFKFHLSLKSVWYLYLKQKKRCALTGQRIYFANRKGASTTASLDRIDSKKGYTLGNVQWVHKDINRMKMAYSQSYFVRMCRKVASFHQR